MTLYTFKNRSKAYKIVAFRATENKALAKRFVRAHSDELNRIGVKNVASSSPSWIKDSNVIVFCLIDMKTNKPFAGMKIDIWNENKSLPIIKSLCNQKFDMLQIVRDHSHKNIAEICGLWVSQDVSGLGISKILIRAAISVLPSLNIGKSIAFASQYTIKTISSMGYETYSEIGDKGMFLYPTEDFESYVALLHDTVNLKGSDSKEKKLILELQKNPLLMRLENEKGRNTLIQYDLRIVKKKINSLRMA